MTWIKIDDQINNHPKMLAAGPLAQLLHFKALVYCGQYLTDGFIPESAISMFIDTGDKMVLLVEGSYFEESDSQVEIVTAKDLADRLVQAGLWEPIANGMANGWQIHDYLKYQPSRSDVLADRGVKSKARSEAGKKGAESRWGEQNQGSSHSKGHSKGHSKPMAKNGPVPVPVPVPDPVPDPDPVEAQLDVEVCNDLDSMSASSASHSTPPSPVASPVKIAIPTTSKGAAGEYPVTDADIAEWHEAYPAVAIMQELREMRQWVISNPSKRKTPRGARAFITRWLAKEQDRGGNGHPSKPVAYSPPYHQPFPKEA